MDMDMDRQILKNLEALAYERQHVIVCKVEKDIDIIDFECYMEPPRKTWTKHDLRRVA